MTRRVLVGIAVTTLVASVLTVGPVAAERPEEGGGVSQKLAELGSGAASMRDENFGTGITECPQAGIKGIGQPKPLDEPRNDDKVEQISNTGDEQRMNVEYSCGPQDETSIDVSPINPRNAVGGANDYRLGFGTSGFYSTTDNGNSWYTGIIPFPSLPNGDNLDGGGDPAIVYDREGVVYYAEINFNRTDDTNGIFVSRSTNGGFTWSRMCVPIDNTPNDPTDDNGRCGGTGDPRQPGDGVVTFNQDQDAMNNFSVPFDDKEYIAAGRRPDNVKPQCFGAFTDAPRTCAPGTIGADRLHVTWTRFTNTNAEILYSFSDDRGLSWSPPRAVSGSAPFCTFGAGNACDFNQFSVPTVNPTTGSLYIAFMNFNTEEENQYLSVRSRDGGGTFEGPFFVSPVFDQNYPRSGRSRQDCRMRGQQTGRQVLTNSCFRLNSGGNVVVDRRGGEFADDLYLVFSDNRNGTRVNSNTDTLLFTSKDGGTTWIGPTRVNDDPSQQPVNRNCGVFGEPACPATNTGNDQWFPWVDISNRGDVNVNFYDRRLDANSIAGEWPQSRVAPNGRPGNYLVWRFGGICSVTTTATVTTGTTTIPRAASQCIAPTAEIVEQPTTPQNAGNELLPEQTVFPFRNFTLSDVPSNWDYAFRAGIFAGDYDVVAIGDDGTAWAAWTDARNGRSSRNQPGRNPLCEQSDAFVELYSSQSGGTVKNAQQTDSEFLVTPCPPGMQEPAPTP